MGAHPRIRQSLSENQDMSCPQILKEAIEGLYSAFSGYALPEDTMPCSCCHDSSANDLLHAAPLRELQWEHVAEYSTEALTVWGDLDCYKHFLPRIFELVLTAGNWPKTPTPELVFGVLRYGQWRSWPQEEQDAITRMLQAAWETVRSNPPTASGYIDVDQWLCCISQCEEDLIPYLDQWMRDERLSSAWALSCLVLGSTIAYTDADTNHEWPAWSGEESLAKFEEWSRLPHRGPFWKKCDAQYAQLQQWVKYPAVLEKLERAAASCGDRDLERELRTARQCILEAPLSKFEVVYRERRFQSAYWDSSNYRLY